MVSSKLSGVQKNNEAAKGRGYRTMHLGETRIPRILSPLP